MAVVGVTRMLQPTWWLYSFFYLFKAYHRRVKYRLW